MLNLKKEDENEQIPNGGVKVILKDDGKTVNKSECIDIPTTNKKETNESKSGETKKKKTKEKINK